jgi:hypothetical protein
MVLARATVVMALAGNPTGQQQAAIPHLNDILRDAEQMVYDYTRTEAADWIDDVTHGYEWARSAAEKLAASNLASMFHDINKKSEVYKKEAMDDLKVLSRIGYGTSRDGDNPSFVIASSRAKTIELHTSSQRYRSKNFFGGDTDY